MDDDLLANDSIYGYGTTISNNRGGGIMGIKKACEECGEEFETRRYVTEKFCAKTCADRNYRKRHPDRMKAYRDKRKEKAKAWRKKDYQENKDKWISWGKQSRSKNLEEYKEVARVKYSKNKYTKEMRYLAGKSLAKARNISWVLSLEEFSLVATTTCSYCKLEFKTTGGGLDRVDNERGYEIDNVVSCCRKCNHKKYREVDSKISGYGRGAKRRR